MSATTTSVPWAITRSGSSGIASHSSPRRRTVPGWCLPWIALDTRAVSPISSWRPLLIGDDLPRPPTSRRRRIEPRANYTGVTGLGLPRSPRRWPPRRDHPGPKQIDGSCLVELLGGRPVRVARPPGERCLVVHVMARGRVLLVHPSEVLGCQECRRGDQGGPQPAVHECDLAVDGTAHEHVLIARHRIEHRVDRVTLRVAPPAARDCLAGDRFGELRRRTIGRDEHHAVLPNERERGIGVHVTRLARARRQPDTRGALSAHQLRPDAPEPSLLRAAPR